MKTCDNQNFAFALALVTLAFNLSILQADIVSPPKPPGLYDGYTTTLLPDGKWLVAGGETGNSSDDADSATLYDPVTGQWTATGSMNIARKGHTATLLPNGKMLVVGGVTNDFACLSSAELYDPTTEKWTMTGSLNMARHGHAAILLTNGFVLMAGG